MRFNAFDYTLYNEQFNLGLNTLEKRLNRSIRYLVPPPPCFSGSGLTYCNEFRMLRSGPAENEEQSRGTYFGRRV